MSRNGSILQLHFEFSKVGFRLEVIIKGPGTIYPGPLIVLINSPREMLAYTYLSTKDKMIVIA